MRLDPVAVLEVLPQVHGSTPVGSASAEANVDRPTQAVSIDLLLDLRGSVGGRELARTRGVPGGAIDALSAPLPDLARKAVAMRPARAPPRRLLPAIRPSRRSRALAACERLGTDGAGRRHVSGARGRTRQNSRIRTSFISCCLPVPEGPNRWCIWHASAPERASPVRNYASRNTRLVASPQRRGHLQAPAS